jgi:hypothetical protein
MMQGDQPPAFVGADVKEADVVLGSDNFIFPGSSSSFDPYADPTKVVFKVSGSEVTTGGAYELPAATPSALGGVKQGDASGVTDVAGLITALEGTGIFPASGE